MGSTTSRAENDVGKELAAVPPKVLSWDGAAESGGTARALQPLVCDFVDVFCEVDPKVHVSVSELLPAMYVHLKNNGVETVHLSINTVHCFVTIILLRATERGLKITGMMTTSRPFELLVIKGIRLKIFPEPQVVPVHTYLRMTMDETVAYNLIAAYRRG